MNTDSTRAAAHNGEPLDHGSDERFLEYYRDESVSKRTMDRFEAVRKGVERIYVLENRQASVESLTVADIGCGAGTQAILWAKQGHTVCALDVNAPLVDLARERAQEAGLSIDLRVGTAAKLPWDDGSVDVCLVPELLEHVPEWEVCLDEFARILRPGGIIYLSTSNSLCPRQKEFKLPFYSWYPGRLKRHYERLAVSTRPELVNYTKYPAVNWFSFYQLRGEFAKRGLSARDRFDFIDRDARSTTQKFVISLIRSLSVLRFLGQVATPHTVIIGLKHGASV